MRGHQRNEHLISGIEPVPREFWSDTNDNFLTPSRNFRLYLNLSEEAGPQRED